MQNKIDSFWRWVEERRLELGISSFRQLETKAGFSAGAIGKRKNEHKLPTVEMAEGMCRALQVDWVELWTHAGLVDRYRIPSASELEAIDADIYRALQGTEDGFKKAVLKTIKSWLSFYQRPRSQGLED